MSTDANETTDWDISNSGDNHSLKEPSIINNDEKKKPSDPDITNNNDFQGRKFYKTAQ
jgi:hypothetical protein